jgi:2-succinyl-5-enolpyruvyl-6-hydroxy-3-cyclohexene-1-carboxylate synthase
MSQNLFAYVSAFVDELSRAGVRNVCIAPGSRSTPLALTIAQHPDLRCWMHLDERSASFFALGMARALSEPVALLCTSGTAAANFFPAVIEARSFCVPVVVLTADRPPELHDVGAAQTIDQNRLYGCYPKWFVDVALPEGTPEMLRYARTIACRAVATAAAVPSGPVHLNFPFREPLVPTRTEIPAELSASDSLAWTGRPDGAPWVNVADMPPVASDETVRSIAARLLQSSRPVIVCGPQFDAGLAEPLGSLAAALDAPLLADAVSQVRWGNHERCAIIDRYDAMLRDPETSGALVPDVILRFGAIPTSKPLNQYLAANGTAYHIVVDAARWPDPARLASEMVHAEPKSFCARLISSISEMPRIGQSHSEWLARWKRADAAADAALANYSARVTETFEGAVLADVAAIVPAAATIVVSSSMPVRDLDSFARGDSRPLRVLSNRGANGIDGVVSTALGASATLSPEQGPLVLVIGDIAFYHDMNGLLAAKLHKLDATIVVINNDGGGIFSFLPQASQRDSFEELFGTPHGLTFGSAAELYGAAYTLAQNTDELRDVLSRGMDASGLHIVEIRTDRTRNVQLHREAWSQVATALKGM